MKKLMLSAAIAAASIGGTAQAKIYKVDSTIGNVPATRSAGFLFGGKDFMDNAWYNCDGRTTGLAIRGTVSDAGTPGNISSSAITLKGNLTFDLRCGAGGPLVNVVFNLGSGAAGSPGVTFSSGKVSVDYKNTTFGFARYGVVDAATTNIVCIGLPIDMSDPVPATNVALAGVPNPLTPPPTCSVNLPGVGVTYLYLKGTLDIQ